MAIFFACLCGQNLREEDERAGGQSSCPACGLPVRVPFPRYVDPVVTANVDADTVLELRAVEVPAPPCAPPPLRCAPPALRDKEEETYPLARRWNGDDTDDSEWERERELKRAESRRLLSRANRERKKERRRQRDWTLEKQPLDFLSYPLRTLPLVLLLALIWATLLAIVGVFQPNRWDLFDVLVRWPVVMVGFLLFGYTIGFLQVTYTTARGGKAGFVARPQLNVIVTAICGAQGLLAFLAGPVVPSAVGYVFWLMSGELGTIDWLIMWQLGIVSVGYWILALFAVEQNNRLRDLHPTTVMKVARQYGLRIWLVAVLIAIPVVGQALQALDDFDSSNSSAGGWLIRVVCWTVQLSWTVLLLRWFGVSGFRNHAPATQSEPEA